MAERRGQGGQGLGLGDIEPGTRNDPLLQRVLQCRRIDQTAARREAARKALAEARSAAAAANKAYDKESAAFDRLRTTGASGAAGR